MPNPLTAADLDQLRRAIGGAVLAPADPDYDGARRFYNAMLDRRPAVIVRVAGAADIATAFAFAAEHALPVAVRGGGHNPAGHCMVDDGLIIDLTQLRTVTVDAAARRAYSTGGATWLDFDTATQAHDLVTPGGVVVSTGVAGLTFGGGLGHLTAQFGLTCDNLIGVDLVTPAGEQVHTDENENPELLWGLRGGGGNFGVATQLTFRLHPLERVLGGLLIFRGEGVRTALRRYRDLVAPEPRDLSCQVGLHFDPDLTPVLEVMPCYTGPEPEPAALRALRAGPGLVRDGLKRQPFLDQQRVVETSYGANRHYWKGYFVRELPDMLLDELYDRISVLGRSPGGILIESLHGAPHTAIAPPGAAGFRGAAFNVSAMAIWQNPAHDAESMAWARATAAAAEPWSYHDAGYANYMAADEPLERVRATYGAETFDRLQALKRRYDPHNVLRRNQNIPPA